MKVMRKINCSTTRVRIRPPYNKVYKMATKQMLEDAGYDTDLGYDYDADVASVLRNNYGLEFAGWAIANDDYFDICEDNNQALVVVDTDGNCYEFGGERIYDAEDWTQYYDPETGEFDDSARY